MLQALSQATRTMRLNWRVARLALTGAWLESSDVAQSYDALAADYDACWLRHIQAVTTDVVRRLPEALPGGRVLDLGCGTGAATGALAARYPNREVVGVDISQGMLAQAQKRLPESGVQWAQADMLRFLEGQPPESAAVVFSGWAAGYSHPRRVIEEAGHILCRGGCFGLIVNYRDTLAPVFEAFRECMRRFPEAVRRAVWPRFPKNSRTLRRALVSAGLRLHWHGDGRVAIAVPKDEERVEWLLRTGVLAGFEAMLPLRARGPVRELFETRLRTGAAFEHHYAALVAERI